MNAKEYFQKVNKFISGKVSRERRIIATVNKQVADTMLRLGPKTDSCVVCGCTDGHACKSGCYWIMPGLCSRCAGESI